MTVLVRIALLCAVYALTLASADPLDLLAGLLLGVVLVASLRERMPRGEGEDGASFPGRVAAFPLFVFGLLADIARGTWDVTLRVMHLRPVEQPGHRPRAHRRPHAARGGRSPRWPRRCRRAASSSTSTRRRASCSCTSSTPATPTRSARATSASTSATSGGCSPDAVRRLLRRDRLDGAAARALRAQVARRPTTAQRILALDLLTLVLIGLLALVAARTGAPTPWTRARARALSFLATLAAARYLGDRRPLG
jgi:multisubunit Na+/H+ antiporter MnhF subunit